MPDQANTRFYFVVVLVVGVLTAGTGFFQLARWRMEDCVALVGTQAACSHSPGTGLLAAGVAMIAVSVAGLALNRRRR